MIRLFDKGTVRLAGIKPEIIMACLIIEPIFAKFGVDLVITAGTDGEGAKHKAGEAINLRSQDFVKSYWKAIAENVNAVLGVEYDFTIEDDHFHLQTACHQK